MFLISKFLAIWITKHIEPVRVVILDKPFVFGILT